MCHQHLKFYHKIPIISYILLKGKCPYCSHKFGFNHLLLELLTPLFFLIIYINNPIGLNFYKYLILTSAFIIIFFLDWENRIIPNLITLPLIVIGLLFSFWSKINIIQLFLGILIGGGILTIVGLVYQCITKQQAIGGGDIKLSIAISIFIGWQLTLFTLFFGSVLGIVYYIFSHKKSETIPYGAFLSLSAYISIIYGKEILNLWIKYLSPS